MRLKGTDDIAVFNYPSVNRGEYIYCRAIIEHTRDITSCAGTDRRRNSSSAA
jgi:hypothetical protein